MQPLPHAQLAATDGGFVINPFLTVIWLLEDVLGVDLPYDQQGPDNGDN